MLTDQVFFQRELPTVCCNIKLKMGSLTISVLILRLFSFAVPHFFSFVDKRHSLMCSSWKESEVRTGAFQDELTVSRKPSKRGLQDSKWKRWQGLNEASHNSNKTLPEVLEDQACNILYHLFKDFQWNKRANSHTCVEHNNTDIDFAQLNKFIWQSQWTRFLFCPESRRLLASKSQLKNCEITLITP
jgi:hypothetical protein